MPVDPMTETGEAIAIVGIGGFFAGSDGPDELWSIVRDAIDATSEVPARRWLIDPSRAFDPRIALADHVYTTRGGFVGRPAVRPGWHRPGSEVVEGLDPVFHLALCVASRAWHDARMERVDRRRTGVVFGNIVLPTETASELSREVLGASFEEGLGLPSPVATRASR